MAEYSKKLKAFFLKLKSYRHYKLLLFIAFCIISCVLSVLLMVVIIRTALNTAPDKKSGVKVLNDASADLIDDARLGDRVARFARALTFKTVTLLPDDVDGHAFLDLHEHMEKSFPLIHSSPFIEKRVINNFSLWYTVKGSIDAAMPYLLMAHMDVVPVTEANWEHPPFGGIISGDSYLYGRGAIDVKVGVMGIMEALEYNLLINGRPKRTVYIAFGHDEELSGPAGAGHIAEAMKASGVKTVAFILDEGLPLTSGILSGTGNQVFAVIGVTEKGSAWFDLIVNGPSGHSSTPPSESAITILAEAIARVKPNSQRMRFGQPESDMFYQIAPYCSLVYRAIFSNLWLFKGILMAQMEKLPTTNAFVRTTTAFTWIRGGIKENVIPASATALLNSRIHHSQTIAKVKANYEYYINDPRVKVTLRKVSAREPARISPYGDDVVPYQIVSAAIKQAYDNPPVVPGLMIANTDTRWYSQFTSNIYRVTPVVLVANDVKRIHGDNERISIDGYHKAVNFYYRIMRNADLVAHSKTTG